MRGKFIVFSGALLITAGVGFRFWGSYEPDVPTMIFNECLPFIEDGRRPFQWYFSWPLSEWARGSASVEIGEEYHGLHIHSPDNFVVWGEDESNRICMLRSLPGLSIPRPILFPVEGFIEEVTRRAAEAGLSEYEFAGEEFPGSNETPSWTEQREDVRAGIRIYISASQNSEDPNSGVLNGFIVVAPALQNSR